MAGSVPDPAGTGTGAGPESVPGVDDPAPGAVPGADGPAADGTAAATAAPAAPGWRGWRGRRPFWGGLLVLLGGAEILFTLRAPLPVVLHIGMQGLAGYLVPAVMVICGVLILFNPAQRLFYSVLAVLAALASWLTSNLGGFLFGMILGVLGACLTFGWLPDQPLRRRRLRRAARGEAPGPAGA
ncbi:DUF6114 domain-containing protein [Kitasatospora sp. NBC_01560]|uniref:DUF6114 domain-containing protein n=1 Tax=Kitasatospora sp. NBC_01560 TaxID=2975965 RepID=UPI00386EA633